MRPEVERTCQYREEFATERCGKPVSGDGLSRLCKKHRAVAELATPPEIDDEEAGRLDRAALAAKARARGFDRLADAITKKDDES